MILYLLVSVLGYEYIRTHYPVEYQTFICNAFYYTISVVSWFQIKKNQVVFFLETNPYYLAFHESVEDFLKLMNGDVDSDDEMEEQPLSTSTWNFIKNGNIILSLKDADMMEYETEIEYDFIMNKRENGMKVLYYDASMIANANANANANAELLQVELSNVKFMIVELHLADEIHDVSFSTSNYNYMVANNRIGKEFLLFFVKNHIQTEKTIAEIESIFKMDDFSLKIMDQDVNERIVMPKDTLHILKDGYEIVNSKNE